MSLKRIPSLGDCNLGLDVVKKILLRLRVTPAMRGTVELEGIFEMRPVFGRLDAVYFFILFWHD